MKVVNLKTNRINNPLGFKLGRPRLSYVVEDTRATKEEAAQIEISLDREFNEIIFDTGKSSDIDSIAFELPIELKPRTRYYWRATVWANNGDKATSDTACFETSKLDEAWEAKWITPDSDEDFHPILSKAFHIDEDMNSILSARVYMSGLGLYELYINDARTGDEYLSPNFNAYNKWIQYQTYDIKDQLKFGENIIDVMLGNGEYKGRFGFSEVDNVNIYGDKFALICELLLEFKDGSKKLLVSDESWTARRSKVIDSNIYDGEVYDATFEDDRVYEVREIDLGYDRLTPRLSLPVKIKEVLKPIELIKTPKGEMVIDMGQNMVGWLEFKNRAPKDSKIYLQYGEILQDGNFYRDNLRTAKAEYTYISSGEDTIVRPYFTFYGFRFVKVTGWPGDIDLEDFRGSVLYSDMDLTGNIKTGDPLIDRLFLNALWGQKGNFLDVPTDCPQRDERMGWTGDAQVFAGTASFNMDTFAFFKKFGYDMYKEQEDAEGKVPHVVPMVNLKQWAACAWGDAATIIPWNVYVQYGDVSMLEDQFNSMKDWVDYIRREDESTGSKRLWTTGFHYGDWLALDGENPLEPFGGTEIAFLASAYYRYSSMLVSKAANVLGKKDLAKEYANLSNEIKEAIIDEYFTKTGRLALNNQTAYVVALFMDLIPEGFKDRVIDDLKERLNKDNNHLKTGFIGTPYLCRVLSENGLNDLAYTLFLNDDFPSWLYAVKMGATTIWERWNSVLPDGYISDTGMNSLNHYAYGSIMEWVYRNVAGLNPREDSPGFRHIDIRPLPDSRLDGIEAEYYSALGQWISSWKFTKEDRIDFKFEVPFAARASLTLPNCDIDDLEISGDYPKDHDLKLRQSGEDVKLELISGIWEFSYKYQDA